MRQISTKVVTLFTKLHRSYLCLCNFRWWIEILLIFCQTRGSSRCSSRCSTTRCQRCYWRERCLLACGGPRRWWRRPCPCRPGANFYVRFHNHLSAVEINKTVLVTFVSSFRESRFSLKIKKTKFRQNFNLKRNKTKKFENKTKIFNKNSNNKVISKFKICSKHKFSIKT